MSARVSVVIPVRDGERYLGEALGSVFAQTSCPAEVIVVDDGSADASAAVAREAGAKVVTRTPGGSAPAARNAGVVASSGDLLAFLDADDTWAPDRLRLGLDALTAPGAPELVFGHVEEHHTPELTPQERAGLPPARGVVPGRVITTLLVRRTVFDRVGPFDEGLPAADFLDWLSRARALGLREHMLEEVVATRRVHLHNTQWGSRPADLLRALRASAQRQGQAGP